MAAATPTTAAAAAAADSNGSKKRKQPSTLFPSASNTASANDEDAIDDDDDEDDDEAPASINVDFAFLTPDPAIDSQALRRLLQQLFYTHSPTLNFHLPIQSMLAQAAHQGVGTVVKLELTPEEQAAQGEEADPYALITALPSQYAAAHKKSSEQDPLLPYFRARFSSSGGAAFSTALETAHKSDTLLLLLHERMVNLPALLAPPLYRILLSELRPILASASTPASDDQDEATKSVAAAYARIAKHKIQDLHVLLFTRLYSDAAFSDDEDEDMDDGEGNPDADSKKKKAKPSFAQRRQKRRKAEQSAAAASQPGVSGDDSLHYFHPEDEILIKYASHSHTFRFPAPPSAVTSFEAPIFGRLFLLPLSALLDPNQPAGGADAEVKLGPALVELESVLAASAPA
ncbi:hypothetical protein V8E36_006214 [Tilletia maclaganii]